MEQPHLDQEQLEDLAGIWEGMISAALSQGEQGAAQAYLRAISEQGLVDPNLVWQDVLITNPSAPRTLREFMAFDRSQTKPTTTR